MGRSEGFDSSFEEFEKLELVGSGGNADVHRAAVTVDGCARSVALKTPRMANYDTVDSSFFDDFIEEAEIWARIDDHDNVVSVLDWGTDPFPWIALEYMEAGNLDSQLSSLSLEEKVGLFEQICDAVFHAHRHGVSHGDLKPENVLLTRDGEAFVAKVGDWGLAQVLLEHSRSTEGMTLAYSAPEQIDSTEYGTPNDRTDIYQLGAIAYELFAERPPFEADSTAGTVNGILNETPARPSRVNPELPAAFDDAVLQALAKEKGDRYESVLYLRDRVLDAASSLDTPDGTQEPAETAPETSDPPRTENEPTSDGPGDTGEEPSSSSTATPQRSIAADEGQGEDGGVIDRLWKRFQYPASELAYEPRGALGDVRFAMDYARSMETRTLKRGALAFGLSLLYGLGLPFVLGYMLDVIRQAATGEPRAPPGVEWRRQFRHGSVVLGVAFASLLVLSLPSGGSGAESALAGIGVLLWLFLLPAFVISYGVTRSLRTAFGMQTLRMAVSVRYLGLLLGVSLLYFYGYLVAVVSILTVVGLPFVGFVMVTAIATYMGRRYATFEFGGTTRPTSEPGLGVGRSD